MSQLSSGPLVGSGLSYVVAGRAVVDGIDVTVAPGRMFGVSGPSGAGKSTLLALLGGLLVPAAGTVRLDDHGIDRAGRERIGVVLQGYGLISALTARENIAIALQARRVARAEVQARVDTVLAEVGLADVADHLVEELSGGQQQRAAVARALVVEPDVLLADEPTAELDADNRDRIMDRLAARAGAGGIVVVASHDPDVIARCTDRIELAAGRAVG